MNDNETTIGEIRARIATFMAERNWNENHKPAHLAMSMCIEAAELLEHFQWGDKSPPANKEAWAQELADIVAYALLFANVNEIDVAQAIETKMKKNAEKYPVSVFNNENNSLDAYWAIKKQSRGEK